MTPDILWKRYQKYWCQVPALGLALDVSRMRFDEGFIERMMPAMAASSRSPKPARFAVASNAAASPFRGSASVAPAARTSRSRPTLRPISARNHGAIPVTS